MMRNAGLKNNNTICYLNSLIQSLLSCEKFVKVIKNNRDEYVKNENIIGVLFYNMIQKIENNIDIEKDNFTLSLKLGFSGQNCSHDALVKIVDILKMEKNFNIKYEKSIFCTKCADMTRQTTNDMITYELFPEQEKKKDFEKIINRELETLNDYTCDKCKQKATQITIHDLIGTNDIFVIMFNQYNEKSIHKYDNVINLCSYKYKLVAKINHIGCLNRGHYWMIKYINSKKYIINDDDIREIGDENMDKYTYMLFYEKIKE